MISKRWNRKPHRNDDNCRVSRVNTTISRSEECTKNYLESPPTEHHWLVHLMPQFSPRSSRTMHKAVLQSKCLLNIQSFKIWATERLADQKFAHSVNSDVRRRTPSSDPPFKANNMVARSHWSHLEDAKKIAEKEQDKRATVCFKKPPKTQLSWIWSDLCLL